MTPTEATTQDSGQARLYAGCERPWSPDTRFPNQAQGLKSPIHKGVGEWR